MRRDPTEGIPATSNSSLESASLRATPLSTPPMPLFIAGICSIPCIVLQQYIVLLLFQSLFCFMWAVRSGKRVRPLYFLFLIGSVAFFHLLTPQGELLFYIWRLPITKGALLLGLRKGMVVSTLVFCSLATVRVGIRIPSRIGGILSTIFVYFDMLFVYRRSIRRKKLLYDIDRLLHNLYYGASPTTSKASYSRAIWCAHIAIAALFFGVHASALLIGRSGYWDTFL